MPITSIRLQNFRSFRDTRSVPLAPLTVVFGKNNAGKSSLLQSLFLLRQTLDRPEGPRLNLSGPLYPAGSYADVVHQHKASVNMKLEFEVSVPNESIWLRGYRKIRGRRDDKNLKGLISLEFASDEPQPPRLVRLHLETDGRQIEVGRGRGRGGPYELRIDGERVDVPHPTFLFATSSFLPHFQLGVVSESDLALESAASGVLREFESALLRMRAVGAFRREPDRRYDYQGKSDSIDLRGQDVVGALIDDSFRRGKARGQLLSSLNRWLASVGRVKMLPLRRISKDVRLYEVRLRDLDSGRWANFADVGFGIGQAFPVLVEGLRTENDGLFVVQEPEIHLHPDAQLAMADFLIQLALTGRRVIVETHSEALLLRIRRAVAETSATTLPGLTPLDVSVLYVNATAGGASKVKELSLDESGDMGQWPSGFMDDVSSERLQLLKASADVADLTESD